MDHRIQQVHQKVLLPSKPHTPLENENKINFKAVLKDAQSLKISKHAQARLDERNIQIPPTKWENIFQKVNEAKQKGVTDSLVITDEATLLVSAKNNTVVTALDRKEVQSRIFTNINGTIVID
ncbi:hypothetical protein BN1058_02021 [Paraliobacillus sp. PM-2]|uniref:TIGR02530 family flagellar biosynthesis protein n=1 Tax=Paraliobacillus sp. PM-2 TaxID=1462524 RepID=UPI00061C3D23|nr:TIGR02530 family flagellar biosynthesis protein [Paraliobacillus sp. PM-2]CQR47694.1 hypothetical protein BN1058_02021 [Paraliobacillus sp. PM-2]